MLVRLEDWRPRLDAYLETVRARPFAWGQHDCALFAAGAVRAMTGTDPTEGWRIQYATPMGAMRVLRDAGYSSVGSLVAAFLRPVAPALADVGDIALMAGAAAHDGLGIVTGPLIAAPTTEGLGFAPRGLMLAAYHLPFADEVV